MERHFNNDFERFLKQNADQYRLYPSTKPWKGIYAHFHGRRKWFGLGAILLLLTGSLITVLVINSPKPAPLANAIPVQKSLPEKTLSVSSSTPVTSTTQANRGSKIPVYSSFIAANAVSRPVRYSESSSTENMSVDQVAVDGNNTESTSQLQSSLSPEIFSPLLISLTDELTDQDIYLLDAEPQHSAANSSQKIVTGYIFPWSIESVLNSYKKKNRIGLQFNFTPTISYRKLSENKAFSQSAQNRSPYNVNDAVTQKPAIGLELGLTAKYQLSQRVRFKTGLQLNVNRYDIKAYDYNIEPATIALANGSRVDSLYTISTYRNFNGNNPNWLQNLYVQVAMPIGVEVKIVGDDKVQFGLAGTIQPLYVVTDKAYLLTTDYKNYTEDSQAPGLIRRWNANTAFETYVSYSTGKLKWQVGPQMRYQILSSFVKKYPIKEHLFDFGLKVGISLNTP